MPGQCFLVFFTFPAFRNSFCGALPPTVGWSFLLAGSSPEADDPASAAIWVNCQVSDDDGDGPTSSSLLASSTRLSASSNVCSTSLMGEGLLAGEGWCTGEGGLLFFAQVFSFLASLAILSLSALGLNTHLPSFS